MENLLTKIYPIICITLAICTLILIGVIIAIEFAEELKKAYEECLQKYGNEQNCTIIIYNH